MTPDVPFVDVAWNDETEDSPKRGTFGLGRPDDTQPDTVKEFATMLGCDPVEAGRMIRELPL